jgi:predicted RNA-binding Zn ribbon-like protein
MGPPRDINDASVVDDVVDKALSLKPAPAPLHHIQLLLNSRNRLAGYDVLSDASTARRWLGIIARRDGRSGVPDFDDAALVGLRDLREALRELLSSQTAGRAPKREALRLLRSTGATTRLSVDIDGSGRPLLVPPSDSRGISRVTGSVMAALASAPPEQFQRLKACVNPDCGWVFYDTSRSRSGTWCLMNVCGARHKMEKYRSRRR